MATLQKQTNIEKVAGSLLMEGAATAIAALAGGPLAALLPVLSNTLANERYRKRIEQGLREVSSMLVEHQKLLDVMSDAQYKLVNEAVLAMLQTTQEEKLDVLRVAVRNALDMTDVGAHEAIRLSRIIRDISAEEAAFVVKYAAAFKYVHVSLPDGASPEGTFQLEPASYEASLVSGLLSLGVLWQGQPTLGQLLRFAPIATDLVKLLHGTDA